MVVGLLSFLMNLVNRNKREINAEIKVTIKKNRYLKVAFGVRLCTVGGTTARAEMALISCMNKNILKK